MLNSRSYYLVVQTNIIGIIVYLQKAEASLSRAQNLNPMVNINADSDKVDDKPDEYFGQFDIVCAMHCTITQLKRINRVCRNQKVKFFAGDVWGALGYVFLDLQEHKYVECVLILINLAYIY